MYLDELKWRVSDLWMDLLYGDSPAGWRIVGNPQTIATLSRKDFLTYHKTHYTAGNTVVVVAGNIQSSIVERRIKRLFENISTLPAKKKKPVVESQDTPRIALEYKDSDQTHIILGVRSFPSSDRRTKVMRVLQSVLSGGMSSRLFQKMREDLGICYYVSAGNDTYTDHGNFSVSAGVDTERLPIAITAILEELVLLKKELVSPQELHKVKEGIIGRLSLSLESSDDIGGFILGRVMAGVPIETPEEIIASVQSVSAEEVQQLAREIFIDATLNLAIVGKHKNKKELLKLLTFNT